MTRAEKIEKFIQVANSATELVGHNGDKFDLAWIRTRCLFHGIPMFPNYITIDTLKIARSKFRFNSNRLNYIADFLGIGQKIKTEFNLWKDILLHKDKKAMEDMLKYCKKDVILLEKVFKHLNTHIPSKSHYGVLYGGLRASCPECGADGENIVRNNTRTTATGVVKVQIQSGQNHTEQFPIRMMRISVSCPLILCAIVLFLLKKNAQRPLVPLRALSVSLMLP